MRPAFFTKPPPKASVFGGGLCLVRGRGFRVLGEGAGPQAGLALLLLGGHENAQIMLSQKDLGEHGNAGIQAEAIPQNPQGGAVAVSYTHLDVYKRQHFSCYDMSMTVMPAYILTVGLIIAYLVGGVMSTAGGISFLPCLMYILQTFLGLYVVLFLVGVFTTITEWKRIHTTPLRKVLYTVTFPLFMLTYIPISMVALFSRKVQWKPIEHHRADRRVLETAAGRK